MRAAAWIGVAGIPTALAGAALALALPQASLEVLLGFLLLYAASRIWPRRKLLTLLTGAQSQSVEAKET